jgi:hypothetical protein
MRALPNNSLTPQTNTPAHVAGRLIRRAGAQGGALGPPAGARTDGELPASAGQLSSRPFGGEAASFWDALMSTCFELALLAPFDPTAVVTSCIESGAQSLFADEASLPAEFFDLSSGLAGGLLHRLSLYQARMAGVVSDLSAHSVHFQAFVREANRGEQFRFLRTRQEAILWLESS